jgi:phosphate starvation-inducible membrane PsiE
MVGLGVISCVLLIFCSVFLLSFAITKKVQMRSRISDIERRSSSVKDTEESLFLFMYKVYGNIYEKENKRYSIKF